MKSAGKIWHFKCLLISCSLLQPVGLIAQQVIYKDSVLVPVTYYDHFSRPFSAFCEDHPNGRYWEFNPCKTNNTIITGMVQNDLDPITRTPRFKAGIPPDTIGCATCVFLNRNIEKWYVANPSPANDTDKVLKFKDSLLFIHKPELGKGVYQFYSGENNFYPLDGKGLTLGLEPELGGHNFSFTSHISLKFKYNANTISTFEFTGDDDVWVFINNKLASDLGGLHPPQTGSFVLNDLAPGLGLVHGGIYNFDFFHAERRWDASTVKITTSIPVIKHMVSYQIIR